jgi:outer membrane lipoprotein-sorting protein
MIIHRPEWQRTMTLEVWTQGLKNSLVRVINPKKDKGNATLTKNDKMWTFSPKTNRVIKIPSSMMNQSWMGSDFSNNDVARADNLLKYYTHTLKGTETHEEQTVFVIESVPFEDAPVVWGKEILKIRADWNTLFMIKIMFWLKKWIRRKLKKWGVKSLQRCNVCRKWNFLMNGQKLWLKRLNLKSTFLNAHLLSLICVIRDFKTKLKRCTPKNRF